MSEKDRSIRPLGRPRGGGPGLRFGFRNARFPSLVSVEVAAKSFVLRRGSNFIFSAPIATKGKGIRRAAGLGWNVLQLRLAVQGFGKKRCGRRVVELRKWEPPALAGDGQRLPRAHKAPRTNSYDSSSVSGNANTIWHLTDEKTRLGGSLSTERQPYAYDPMGRVTGELQCTPGNCSGVTVNQVTVTWLSSRKGFSRQ